MADDDTHMRSTLSAGVALAATLALAAPASAASETARSTHEFLDSVGVNIHSTYSNTPYDRHDEVLAALRDLGIRHVRDNFMPPTEGWARQQRQRAFRRALADAGIRSTVILGKPGEDPAAYVAAASADDPGVIAGLEGANEHDLSKRADWAAEVRDYQRRLFDAAKADPRARAIPVLGPSVGNTKNTAAFGDVSAWVDRGSVHAYPGGRAPSTFTDVVAEQTDRLFGGKAPIVTETGYHNAMNVWNGHPPVPESIAAVYLPRLFLDNFRRGIERTFSYELLNAYSNPSLTHGDSHFGLLRHDFSPKPAAVRLRNLLRLVDAGAATGARGTLEYALHGDASGIDRVLLRRADGTFVLALWQRARVFDEYARRVVGVPARTLELRVGPQVTVAAGRPAESDVAAPVSGPTHAVSLTVPGDDVLVVELRPTGGATAPVQPQPPSGGTDAATPPPPPPPPTTATVPRTTLQQQWDRAVQNLRRMLGLRDANGAKAKRGATAPKGATRAKKQAKGKQKAKRTRAKAKARTKAKRARAQARRR